MLSCVSRWSRSVSVHSSHSGWSTSVWPDMMSNRSLVTWAQKTNGDKFNTCCDRATRTLLSKSVSRNKCCRDWNYLQSATQIFHGVRCFSDQCEAVSALCWHHPADSESAIFSTSVYHIFVFFAPFQTGALTVQEGCTSVTPHLVCLLQTSPTK